MGRISRSLATIGVRERDYKEKRRRRQLPRRDRATRRTGSVRIKFNGRFIRCSIRRSCFPSLHILLVLALQAQPQRVVSSCHAVAQLSSSSSSFEDSSTFCEAVEKQSLCRFTVESTELSHSAEILHLQLSESPSCEFSCLKS